MLHQWSWMSIEIYIYSTPTAPPTTGNHPDSKPVSQIRESNVIQQKTIRIHWPSSMFNGESFFHQSHPDPFMTPGKVYVGVSKNNGTPKSSILTGFSIINHPFWGTSICRNTHVGICEKKKRRKRSCFVGFIAEVRKISSAKAILGASHVLELHKMCG